MRRGSSSLVVALVLVAGTARADKTQEKTLAETLFREAKSLVAAGKIPEACPKFAESQRLDPTVGTLLHLATCHEEEGKTASAWSEFNEAATLAGKANQREREKQARRAAQALEPKLSKLVVSVTGPLPGPAVSVDGTSLGSGSFGVALPFDPGTHQIEATAPGKQRFTASVTLEAGAATKTVEIPALADEAAPAPPPAPPPAPVAPVAPPTSSSSAATVGVVLGAAGFVGIGLGAFFGLRASSQASDADAFCQGKLCSPEGLAGHEDAKSSALVSTVAVGAGALLLAGGAVLYFTAPKSGAARGVAVAPVVVASGGGASALVRW